MLSPTALVRRAFTLIELLVVIAIIAILVGILLPALAEARRSGKLAICGSNMHQFAIGMQNYASDFKDLLYTYTWRDGIDYGMGVAGSELQAARDQAVYILRQRGLDENAPQITTAWFPHALYGHLIINDYLQQRLPEKMVICPEDSKRALWQQNADPAGGYTAFLSLPTSDRPNPAGIPEAERLPYSSTYMQMPAEWSVDIKQGSTNYVYQDLSTAHNFMIFMGDHVVTPRRLTEVQFPGQKVYLADEFQRHTGKVAAYYAYPDTKQPVAFFDSSVRTVATNRTNYGFNPQVPPNYSPPPGAGVTRFTYLPQTYEPPARGAGGSDIVVGYYRWTRAGLRGVDTGGHEASSGGTPPPGGSGGT